MVESQQETYARLAFSVHEAAAALGLSASSIWKWISLGQLRAIKLGGRTLITAEELNRVLIEGIRNRPPPTAGGSLSLSLTLLWKAPDFSDARPPTMEDINSHLARGATSVAMQRVAGNCAATTYRRLTRDISKAEAIVLDSPCRNTRPDLSGDVARALGGHKRDVTHPFNPPRTGPPERRAYQRDVIAADIAAGRKRILVLAPTGAGADLYRGPAAVAALAARGL
jgi:excisionase family DNA binding protein